MCPFPQAVIVPLNLPSQTFLQDDSRLHLFVEIEITVLCFFKLSTALKSILRNPFAKTLNQRHGQHIAFGCFPSPPLCYLVSHSYVVSQSRFSIVLPRGCDFLKTLAFRKGSGTLPKRKLELMIWQPCAPHIRCRPSALNCRSGSLVPCAPYICCRLSADSLFGSFVLSPTIRFIRESIHKQSRLLFTPIHIFCCLILFSEAVSRKARGTDGDDKNEATADL